MTSKKSTKKAVPNARPKRDAAHPYWGRILTDSLGTKPERQFKLKAFKGRVEVYFDEDVGDGVEVPTRETLDALALTFKQFIAEQASYFAAIRKAAFKRYRKLYAHYYEDPSNGEPLGIHDEDAHAKHLGDRVRLRVTNPYLYVSFWYPLDREHGLEFKFSRGKLRVTGGFSDT